MKRSLIIRGLALLAFACAMPLALAQTPTSSFSLLGHLEELDVDDLGNPLSAGWLTVNGVRVRMPANLLITMPGQYLTLNDLFRGPHPGAGATIKPAVIRLQYGMQRHSNGGMLVRVVTCLPAVIGSWRAWI